MIIKTKSKLITKIGNSEITATKDKISSKIKIVKK